MPEVGSRTYANPRRLLRRNLYQAGPGFLFVATQGGRPPDGAPQRERAQVVRRRRAALRRWADGEALATVCADLGCSRASLFRWRTRYQEDGLAGLLDRPRVGRASELPPAIERLVLTVRLLTYWNSRRLAAEFRRRGVWPLSHGQVDRLLARQGTHRPSYVRTPGPRYLGIRQKNGAPGHPQTQGKIERFQQTLKRWLTRQPAAHSLAELQAQLDRFRLAYNDQRPHRAVGRIPPAEAYTARPKAHPAGRGAGHFRLRYDVTDGKGAMTLRRAGRLHHLNSGVAHARRQVLVIVDEHEVTVVSLDTGEILSSHRVESAKGYWRNTRRDPGRWPRSRATD